MKSAICSLLFLTQQSLSSGAGWNYHNIAEWSVIENSMCSANDESPIDIQTSEVVYDANTCSADFKWNVDFTKQTWKVENNKHSMALTPAEATNLAAGSEGVFIADNTTFVTLSDADNAIASFPNYFQPLGSEHNKFCLHGFHFHWGSTDTVGSEHLVDGEQFPLELHFVHYSCHHADVGEVLAQFPTAQSVQDAKAEEFNDVHQLAVIGVFFEVSEEDNPAFEALLTEKVLNATKFPEHEPVVAHDLSIGDLVPYEEIESAGYYAYEGSLTTPPCTNIVRWHVMNARGSISEKQLDLLRTLMTSNTSEEAIVNNYRDIQDNVNTVYGCMEPEVDSADALKTERAIVWTIAILAILTTIVMGIVCVWMSKKEKVIVKTALVNKGKQNKPTHGNHH